MTNIDEDPESVEVLEEIARAASARFSDEMKWIDDIERKASSLFAINGVVLALTVPLLSLLYTIFQDAVTNNIGLFLVCIVLYAGVIIFLGISIYFAHCANKVETYLVPDISELIRDCKQNKNLSLIDVYKTEISDLDKALEKMPINRNRKAECVKKSQKFFFIGVIVLIIILILSLICIATQNIYSPSIVYFCI